MNALAGVFEVQVAYRPVVLGVQAAWLGLYRLCKAPDRIFVVLVHQVGLALTEELLALLRYLLVLEIKNSISGRAARCQLFGVPKALDREAAGA